MELRKFHATENTTSAVYKDGKDRQHKYIEKEHKPHDDLKNQMELLRPIYHNLIGKMGTAPAVTGFELFNSGDDLGIIITGSIQIPKSGGDRATIPTPLRRFADKPIFKDSDDCKAIIGTLKTEVDAFYFSEKYVTENHNPNQTSIDDE